MDDSDQAENALTYALDNHPEAAVTVLQVVGVPSMLMGQSAGLALQDDVGDAARERAEPVFERAKEIAAKRDREIDTAIGIGHPARNILDRADDYDAVVIGSHGDDWSRVTHRYLVGNVAQTVLRRASVPVTVVR